MVVAPGPSVDTTGAALCSCRRCRHASTTCSAERSTARISDSQVGCTSSRDADAALPADTDASAPRLATRRNGHRFMSLRLLSPGKTRRARQDAALLTLRTLKLGARRRVLPTPPPSGSRRSWTCWSSQRELLPLVEGLGRSPGRSEAAPSASRAAFRRRSTGRHYALDNIDNKANVSLPSVTPTMQSALQPRLAQLGASATRHRFGASSSHSVSRFHPDQGGKG